jgi:uncharacterized membrane protein YhaH (DUF805 family)
MKWYLEVLKKYAVFTGRASRKEFWIFGLINVAIIFALKGIELLVGRSNADSHIVVVRLLYEAAAMIPTVAVSVRRLHDTNRTGWWYLTIFIPVVGIIKLMIDFAEDSQPGDNRYGPNPNGVLPTNKPLVI